MSDREKNPTAAGNGRVSDDTVDEILAEMYGSGKFTNNEDFSGLYSKYLGDSTGRTPDGYEPKTRVEYEAPAEKSNTHSSKAYSDDVIPENVRDVYNSTQDEARRPEFTSSGSVKYPSMGQGASEERVVFDEEWEEQAKRDAAAREDRRRNNALMGDSTYARAFVSGGVPMANRGTTAPKTPARNLRFVDPLSDSAPAQKTTTRQTAQPTPKRVSPYIDPLSDTEPSGSVSAAGELRFGQRTETKHTAEKSGPAVRSARRSVPAPKADDTKTLIDKKVLDAFSASQSTEDEFRARWKDEIEQAEKRKKERAAAAKKKQEERDAALRRKRVEEKALAGDVPGIPLEFSSIDGDDDDSDGFSFDNMPFEFSEELLDDEKDKTEKTEKKDKMKNYTERVNGSSAKNSTVSDKKVKMDLKSRTKFGLKTKLSKEGIKMWSHENLPSKGDSAATVIRKSIRIVAFIALIAAIIYLLIYFVNYEKRRINDSRIDDEFSQEIDAENLDEMWADIKAKYPDVDFPEGMNIKFANTYAINQDVVGYLKIDGDEINISTILLQNKENDDYYLYRDLYKQKSRYGNPFVKATSNMGKEGLSHNTIIYGHNTHDGLMFHKLEKYMTVDGYIDAPTFTLDTLYGQTKWKIFAVMLTNADPAADNGNLFSYLYSEFDSTEHCQSVLDGINQRSMITTGVDVTTDDKLVTIYTCYQSIFKSGRIAIVARQLRDGESEEIDTSKVMYNYSARFPQAYYDAKKLKNPYA